METPNAPAVPPADTGTPPAAPATPPADTGTPPADTGTPPADTGTPPADPSDDDGEPRPGSRAAERIRELVAQNKRNAEFMQEYADYWRQKALATAAPAAPAPAANAPADDPAPALDQFDSTEKWAAELTAWTKREAERIAAATTEKTLSTRDQQQQQHATRQSYNGRLAEFVKTTPDAVATIANPIFSAVLERQPVITEVVMASENGPALAYHLARNPIEADRISRMTPVQAAAAIGRIEAKLAAPKPSAPTPPPRTTNAPPPPEPISGSGAASIDLSKVDIKDYVRIRAEQRAARRR